MFLANIFALRKRCYGIDKLSNHSTKLSSSFSQIFNRYLDNLKNHYQFKHETDKTMIAVKAADTIRNNPNLKARVMGAIKSGGEKSGVSRQAPSNCPKILLYIL
jgi:hypothetical protein